MVVDASVNFPYDACHDIDTWMLSPSLHFLSDTRGHLQFVLVLATRLEPEMAWLKNGYTATGGISTVNPRMGSCVL